MGHLYRKRRSRLVRVSLRLTSRKRTAVLSFRQWQHRPTPAPKRNRMQAWMRRCAKGSRSCSIPGPEETISRPYASALFKPLLASDKTNPEYQRLLWDPLSKSITGIVNQVNIGNIKQNIPEFGETLLWRKRFCAERGGPGGEFGIYASVRCGRSGCEYQAAAGRRARACTACKPVQEIVQAEWQGATVLIFVNKSFG